MSSATTLLSSLTRLKDVSFKPPPLTCHVSLMVLFSIKIVTTCGDWKLLYFFYLQRISEIVADDKLFCFSVRKNTLKIKINLNGCLWTQRTHKKNENRRLGFIENLHIQQYSLRGCLRTLTPALEIFKVTRPRGYKTFFMLNSAEREIFSANKYENANNSWHFHIY